MSKSIQHVISFSNSKTAVLEELIDHDNLISPPYKAKTWNHYQNQSGAFNAGIWEADACTEKFTSNHEELCHILEGVVRLTDSSGDSKIFKAGESFTIPVGFSGTWENLVKVKKIYATCNPIQNPENQTATSNRNVAQNQQTA